MTNAHTSKVEDYLKEDGSPIWYSESSPRERRAVLATAVALGFEQLRAFESEFRDANGEMYEYTSLKIALHIWKTRYGTKMARKRSLETLINTTIQTVQRISKKRWTNEMIEAFTFFVKAIN